MYVALCVMHQFLKKIKLKLKSKTPTDVKGDSVKVNSLYFCVYFPMLVYHSDETLCLYSYSLPNQDIIIGYDFEKCPVYRKCFF